jgi:hypothetical protein
MPDGKLNPLRLAPADAARLLSKAGGKPVDERQIVEAVEAGAPVDNGGDLNLVHLGAWLLREIGGFDR